VCAIVAEEIRVGYSHSNQLIMYSHRMAQVVAIFFNSQGNLVEADRWKRFSYYNFDIMRTETVHTRELLRESKIQNIPKFMCLICPRLCAQSSLDTGYFWPPNDSIRKKDPLVSGICPHLLQSELT